MKLTDLKTQYNGEIVLLTKDQCAQCDHMKRRLNRMGESYTEINLEKHPELLADVKAQGARTAPVMLTPRGKLLTTNVVEMENQLKEELKQPRNHHLYDLNPDLLKADQSEPKLSGSVAASKQVFIAAHPAQGASVATAHKTPAPPLAPQPAPTLNLGQQRTL